MIRMTRMFTVGIILISLSGCSNNNGISLATHENLITEDEISKVISYSGIIEKNVIENPDGSGIHYSFGTEGFVSQKGREGRLIFIAHIELLSTDKTEFFDDMKGVERLSTDISDYAWYEKTPQGNHYIIFYIENKNIIVEIWGYNHEISTFIDKDGLINLALLIKNRL